VDILDEAIRKLGKEKGGSYLEVPELYHDRNSRLYYSYPREIADQSRTQIGLCVRFQIDDHEV
jgi:hypothetical protein